MNRFKKKYKLLNKINSPSDLKSFSLNRLEDLADEIRQKIIEEVQRLEQARQIVILRPGIDEFIE